MSEPTERHPIALKKVVYEIPGMDSAVVRRDVKQFLAIGPPPCLNTACHRNLPLPTRRRKRLHINLITS